MWAIDLNHFHLYRVGHGWPGGEKLWQNLPGMIALANCIHIYIYIYTYKHVYHVWIIQKHIHIYIYQQQMTLAKGHPCIYQGETTFWASCWVHVDPTNFSKRASWDRTRQVVDPLTNVVFPWYMQGWPFSKCSLLLIYVYMCMLLYYPYMMHMCICVYIYI